MNTKDGGQVTGNPNLVLLEQFRVCMGVGATSSRVRRLDCSVLTRSRKEEEEEEEEGGKE